MRDCPIIQANREVMALHSKNRSKNRLNPTDVQHRQRPDNIANPTNGCRSVQTDYKSSRN